MIGLFVVINCRRFVFPLQPRRKSAENMLIQQNMLKASQMAIIDGEDVCEVRREPAAIQAKSAIFLLFLFSQYHNTKARLFGWPFSISHCWKLPSTTRHHCLVREVILLHRIPPAPLDDRAWWRETRYIGSWILHAWRTFQIRPGDLACLETSYIRTAVDSFGALR